MASSPWTRSTPGCSSYPASDRACLPGGEFALADPLTDGSDHVIAPDQSGGNGCPKGGVQQVRKGTGREPPSRLTSWNRAESLVSIGVLVCLEDGFESRWGRHAFETAVRPLPSKDGGEVRVTTDLPDVTRPVRCEPGTHAEPGCVIDMRHSGISISITSRGSAFTRQIAPCCRSFLIRPRR